MLREPNPRIIPIPPPPKMPPGGSFQFRCFETNEVY